MLVWHDALASNNMHAQAHEWAGVFESVLGALFSLLDHFSRLGWNEAYARKRSTTGELPRGKPPLLMYGRKKQDTTSNSEKLLLKTYGNGGNALHVTLGPPCESRKKSDLLPLSCNDSLLHTRKGPIRVSNSSIKGGNKLRTSIKIQGGQPNCPWVEQTNNKQDQQPQESTLIPK